MFVDYATFLMPIKVLIMVIEGDALLPTFTQAPKSGFHMEILAGFVVGYFAAYLSILGCEPWYFKNSHFYRGMLDLVLGGYSDRT
jgi:hypothetical protein